jgi:hypothetical protein
VEEPAVTPPNPASEQDDQAISNQICARICAQDAAGRLETRETQRAGYERPPSVLRGQRGDQRRRETAETRVVWLITQRSGFKSRPRYQGQRPFLETEKGPLACVNGFVHDGIERAV